MATGLVKDVFPSGTPPLSLCLRSFRSAGAGAALLSRSSGGGGSGGAVDEVTVVPSLSWLPEAGLVSPNERGTQS